MNDKNTFAMRPWQEIYINQENRYTLAPAARTGAIGESRLPWKYLEKPSDKSDKVVEAIS